MREKGNHDKKFLGINCKDNTWGSTIVESKHYSVADEGFRQVYVSDQDELESLA